MKPIMGQSDAIRRIDRSVSTLATSDGPVCVYGERGTGKTLIAQTIHARDPGRAGQSLVVVHCATLPAGFTEGDKILALFEGAFQVARGGTLVLKEVPALSAATQSLLHCALKQHISADAGVRVIATASTDLVPLMQQGQFHTGLFHRLAGITMTVPPLRKRKSDIPWLVAHFIGDLNVRYCRDIQGITPQALRILLKHDWPGNVQELKRCIEHAVLKTDRAVIDCPELEDAINSMNGRGGFNSKVKRSPNGAFSPTTEGIARGTGTGSEEMEQER